MPEILPDHVPSPRTLLAWDGTAYRPVTIDPAGHLQIDVLGNANLDAALQSVATDRLIVRGEDQLHSFGSVLAATRNVANSGIDGYVDSVAPGAGVIWVVTDVIAVCGGRATTRHRYYLHHDAATYEFYADAHAIAAGERTHWGGWKHLDEGDTIRVYFDGTLAGNFCAVSITGHIMTLEV